MHLRYIKYMPEKITYKINEWVFACNLILSKD